MSDTITENQSPIKPNKAFNFKDIVMQNDIIYFKEEILEEINQFEKNLLKKNNENNKKINEQLILCNSTINDLKNKFKELLNIAEINKYLKEEIDKWNIFKSEILDIFTTNKIKINILEKDTNDNLFRINKILNNTVLYPRIIGNNSQFKTFHEYIDYTVEKLSTSDNFRNRMELDFKYFKAKIDKIIDFIKIKIDTSINAANQLVNTKIKENEITIKDYINSKIFDIQVKNKEMENIVERNKNELNKIINNMNNILNDKIEKEITKINEEKKFMFKQIDECKNKILALKNEIKLNEKNKTWFKNNKMEIIDMIKDIIEEEKIVQNLEKKDKCDCIPSSNLENKENKKKSNKSHHNRAKSFDLKNNKKNKNKESLSEENIENKYYSYKKIKNSNDEGINNTKIIKTSNDDEFSNTKNRKTSNNNYSNNIKIKTSNDNGTNNNNNIKTLIDDVSNDTKKINKTEKNFYINKFKDKFKSIKDLNELFDSEENIINVNNINNLIMKDNKITNSKMNNNITKNKTNFNLVKYNIYSKDNKSIKLKNPFKSLLKLNLNFQDINAQFHSESNLINSNSKNNKIKKSQSIEKIELKKYLPYTSRNINNNEIFSYNNKIQNISNFSNRNIKDIFKIKNQKIKTRFNIDSTSVKINNKENK